MSALQKDLSLSVHAVLTDDDKVNLMLISSSWMTPRNSVLPLGIVVCGCHAQNVVYSDFQQPLYIFFIVTYSKLSKAVGL